MPDPLECLDGPQGCAGEVEYRTRPSDFKSFPRCEKHAEAWYESIAETGRRYGGVAPPSDFDPSYAGERWEEDY